MEMEKSMANTQSIHLRIIFHEKVFRFDVSMCDIKSVTSLNGTTNL